MSSEDRKIQIMKYTQKAIFVFRPMQPSGTVASIEWLMEYYFNWQLSETKAYDMGKIKYQMYNYNTSTWDTLDSAGHNFLNNPESNNEEYVGHLTTQMFYAKIETNPSYYISDDGFVEAAISFETTDANQFTEDYTLRNCELVTAYNGIIISD